MLNKIMCIVTGLMLISCSESQENNKTTKKDFFDIHEGVVINFKPAISWTVSSYYKKQLYKQFAPFTMEIRVTKENDLFVDNIYEDDGVCLLNVDESHYRYYVEKLMPLDLYTDSERNTNWYKQIEDEANSFLGIENSCHIIRDEVDSVQLIYIDKATGRALIMEKQGEEPIMPITYIGPVIKKEKGK